MNKASFIAVLLALAMFQVALPAPFKVFGAGPDLLLAAGVFAALSFDLPAALTLNVIAGFLKDATGIQPFGINAPFFALWAFLSAKLARKVTLDTGAAPVVLASVVCLAHNLAARLLFALLARPLSSSGVFVRILIFESLYTAAAFYLLQRSLSAMQEAVMRLRRET